MNPSISIVMPCRNEEGSIEACLTSILALEQPDGGVEILVVDGMSTDRTREIVGVIASRSPEVRMLDNPAHTTPHALNIGIRSARGSVIFRMDAHTEYAPDYLTSCLAALESTGADNVGGPARTHATGYLQRAIAAAYHSRFAVGNALFHQTDYEGPADTVPYGCWKREAFDRFGLFDEDLARNQDDEHNFRICKGGGLVWQSPSIKSWYSPRASLSGLFRQYFQYGYWKVRVIQKHGAPASWRHLIPAVFVTSLSILTVLAFIHKVFAFGLLALAGTYLACVAAASVMTAVRSNMLLLPALIPVYACYHFAYGLGFIAGLWDFQILRRTGRFIKLSRDAHRGLES